MRCYFGMTYIYEFKKKNFNKILNVVGLDSCKKHFWRLEFQSMGAPHAHCLIWLDEELDIGKIDHHVFAKLLESICPDTHEKIQKYMTHKCSPENCFKKGNCCRFCFPKNRNNKNLMHKIKALNNFVNNMKECSMNLKIKEDNLKKKDNFMKAKGNVLS